MDKVRCPVCPHHCELTEGSAGLCGSRTAKDGVSRSLTYGKIVSAGLDPIEKKPLRFYHPGRQILSVGQTGCNLDCPFCQNWQIAHPSHAVSFVNMPPEELAKKAETLQSAGNIGIAYTYNEPLIGYEYIRDTARIAKPRGLHQIVVSNGYTTDFVLDQLLPWVDAWNIDLKGPDAFYKELGGRLDPVLHTISRAASRAHVELTTLVIPGKNDDPVQLEALVQNIAAIDPDLPLHLSRFFPARQWSHLPATPLPTLHRLETIAKKYLSRVLLGNVSM